MPRSLSGVCRILRSLGDESRLKIALALREQSLCVCQIVELLRLAPSTVSEHLTTLRAAGVVTARKQGRWMHYRIAADGRELLKSVLGWAGADTASHGMRNRLRRVLSMDPSELCRRQKREEEARRGSSVNSAE